MKKAKATCYLLALSGAMSTGPASATISTDWIAGRDFRINELSATELSNPNGQVPEWSYGFLDPPDGAFTLFATGDHTNTLVEGYANHATQATLAVNTTSAPIVLDAGEGPYSPLAPDEVVLHPGGAGREPILRWTAPQVGRYTGTFGWQDIDPHGGDGGTGSLRRNGTEIQGFSWVNTGNASGAFDLVLNIGDTLDFALGRGGNFLYDSTSFNASINAVPLPTAVWLLSPALGGLVLRRRSKEK